MSEGLQYLVNVNRNSEEICMWTLNVFDQTVNIKLIIIKGYYRWGTLPFPYTTSTQWCFD